MCILNETQVNELYSYGSQLFIIDLAERYTQVPLVCMWIEFPI